MSGHDSECTLLDASVAGDSIAFERLLLDSFSTLRRYIEPKIPVQARRHLDAADVLQEVLPQALRDIGQFEASTNNSFYAWLKAIADRRLADALKRFGRRKRGGQHHQVFGAVAAKGSTFASLVEFVCQVNRLRDRSAARREAKKMLQVAVAMLPDQQRGAVCTHYLIGRTIVGIAHQTGQTTPAIRGLIHRGKKILAQAMGRSSC